MENVLSLENFDERKADPPYLNSPRSIDACRRKGIEPSELVYMDFNQFKETLKEKPQDNALLQMHWEHNEKNRKKKLSALINERLSIIEEEKKGLWKPLKCVHQSSKMNKRSNSGSTDRNIVSDSSMLASEQKQLEKIQQRQQQELRQMLEYEQKMQEINKKNEERMQEERKKEERRAKEMAAKQKEVEEAAKRKEEERRKKERENAEREKQMIKEAHEKAMKNEEKEREKEKKRQQEIKRKEEEQRKKQEAFKTKVEKNQIEEQKLAEKRRQEREEQANEKKAAFELNQKRRTAKVEEKQKENQEKLQRTRLKMEYQLEKKRKVAEKKKKDAEERRKKLEEKCQDQNRIAQLNAQKKAEEIERVQARYNEREEDKKNQFIEKQKETEERSKERMKAERMALEEKQKQDQLKEKHRKEVLEQVIREEDARKQVIAQKMKAMDEKLMQVQEEQEKERKQKAYYNVLKNEDRKEGIKRIERVNEYKKEKIVEKLTSDDERTKKFQLEKTTSMETREKLRKKADLQKQEMLENFEKMKRKGVANPKDLKQLDPNANSQSTMVKSTPTLDKKYEGRTNRNQLRNKHMNSCQEKDSNRRFKGVPNKPTSTKHKEKIKSFCEDKKNPKEEQLQKEEEAVREVNELRKRLHNELITAIEEEKDREDKRDELMINAAGDEKARLEKIFGIERIKAYERITALSDEHERQISVLMKKHKLIEVYGKSM